ncbi:hypothetical protein OBBRIDRAFT_792341 [Obba rivulosa]|uniref:Uncharacterized protein n=1 Tax=Obba rivulosa TaxID=1052685 RepID=A0A8E2DLC2_9APHY|nr:hypothetical protein OBBRIDRAFT_792341 [Obba rivulosa]
MADPSQTVQMMTPAEAKRRKSTPDAAKATYLTSQLRLRLQYAKLKVEHGWQRQNLNEVENLYFRHTQKHRPPPTISPGGRRNLRNAPSHTSESSSSASTSSTTPGLERSEIAETASTESSQHGAAGAVFLSSRTAELNGRASNASASGGRSWSNGASSPPVAIQRTDTLKDVASPPRGVKRKHADLDRSSSTASSATLPDSGFGSQASIAAGSMGPPTHALPHPFSASSSASPALQPSHNPTPAGAAGATRMGYPHYYPQTHMPYPALPARPAPAPTGATPNSFFQAGGGLTYDAFWSSHGSATSAYRSVLANSPALLGRTDSAGSIGAAEGVAGASAPGVSHGVPGATPSTGATMTLMTR